MMISGSEPMQLNRRHMMTGLAALAGASLLARPAWAAGRVRLSGRAFGTGWSVLAGGLSDPQAMGAAIDAILAGIDVEMSPFRPDSALSRFNAGAGVTVSSDMEVVLAEALRLAHASDGAFDPGVGPLVARYGFGPIRGGYAPGGWRQVSCENGRLSGTGTLDLCGIAKGHAVDRVALLLATRTDDYLVEIGGEIRAGRAASLGIADPVRGGVHSRVRLPAGLAIATSGDGVNGYDLGGRRWSHLIDPVRGQPVENRVASVSVMADSAMRADGLATALMVLGETRGQTLASAEGVAALFLLREGAGLRAAPNAAFAALQI